MRSFLLCSSTCPTSSPSIGMSERLPLRFESYRLSLREDKDGSEEGASVDTVAYDCLQCVVSITEIAEVTKLLDPVFRYACRARLPPPAGLFPPPLVLAL